MASNPIIISRRQSWWGRIVTQLSGDLGAWLYLAAVLALASLLAFVYLAQASYTARQIDEMTNLQEELAELHEQNSALRLLIAEYEDITRIQSEARAMGLGEATRVEYVEVVLDEPATPNNSVSGSPSSRLNTGQPSSLQGSNGLTAWPNVRLTSVIARQFEGWISRGTATLGSR